jgi:hypothetical protein
MPVGVAYTQGILHITSTRVSSEFPSNTFYEGSLQNGVTAGEQHDYYLMSFALAYTRTLTWRSSCSRASHAQC